MVLKNARKPVTDWLHERHACKSTDGEDSKPDLVLQLDDARVRLDRHTELLQWSLDFREQLYLGIWDLDDAVAEAAAFKRACRTFEWRVQ